MPIPFLHYRDDAWYAVGSGNASATPVVADTAYAFPIYRWYAGPIRRLNAIIGVSVPATNMRMALYTGNPLVGALSLVLGSMSEYDMSGGPNSNLELDFVTPQLVGPGYLWAVTRFNGPAQPWCATANLGTGSATMEFPALLGAPTATPRVLAASVAAASPSRLTTALAYASAWPATLTGWVVGFGNPGSPLVQWRQA